jgi:hypothetical protein
MFIAILSVRLKVKSYVHIYNMAAKYWDIISNGMDLSPTSEKDLRGRLKKIVISLETQQRSFLCYCPSINSGFSASPRSKKILLRYHGEANLAERHKYQANYVKPATTWRTDAAALKSLWMDSVRLPAWPWPGSTDWPPQSMTRHRI